MCRLLSMGKERRTVQVEKCSLFLCGKYFCSKEKGFKYWRYCLLIEMAAVVGKGESYVNVFALGYSGYRQVGLCGSVWLNELPVCHRHYINGSVCGGSPQTGEHVKHTFFYCPPPQRRPSPPPRHSQIRILPAQLQGHMFMFIVLVCSSVKSRSKRRGRREEREE